MQSILYKQNEYRITSDIHKSFFHTLQITYKPIHGIRMGAKNVLKTEYKPC